MHKIIIHVSTISGHPPTFITSIYLSASSCSFTKRIPGCSHLSYLERLSHLNLHTLEQRRFFANLIMRYSIVKTITVSTPLLFFSFRNYKFSQTPGSSSLRVCHPCLEFFAKNNCNGSIYIQFQTQLACTIAPHRFLKVSNFSTCYYVVIIIYHSIYIIYIYIYIYIILYYNIYIYIIYIYNIYYGTVKYYIYIYIYI